MKFAKYQLFKLLKKIVPNKLRRYISRTRTALLRNDVSIFPHPTYDDDGLISQHVVGFLNDQKFMNAYQRGKKTGALDSHPGDIHFRAYIACWAAKYASSLEGDFVECGVGKGLLSRAVAHYVDFEESDKKFYLFDTFSGIPTEQHITDGEHENMISLNKTHFNYDYYDNVKQTFKKYSNVILVKGKVPETFNGVKLDRVSYISIDMNNAAAEISAIEFLWDKLVNGGVIVLDDYAYGSEFSAQKDSWDIFSEKNNFEILTLPTGQGLIIKNANANSHR